MNVAITVDEPSLLTAVLKSAADQLNARASRAKERIRDRVRHIIYRAISSSPEAVSLQGGVLQGHLGVKNPRDAIAAIIAALQASMEVNVYPFRATSIGIDGKLEVLVSRKDLSDVLGIEEASFTSEKGFEIKWLEWLLKAGDSIVIQDYHFVGGAFKTSRTRLGLMFKKGTWRVPAEFSGTEDRNWLTKAFDAVGKEVVQVLVSEMSV